MRAGGSEREGRRAGALSHGAAAVATDPASARAVSLLQATRSAYCAMALRPHWSKSHFRLASVMEALGKHDEALCAYVRGLDCAQGAKEKATMRQLVAQCAKAHFAHKTRGLGAAAVVQVSGYPVNSGNCFRSAPRTAAEMMCMMQFSLVHSVRYATNCRDVDRYACFFL